MTHTYDSSGASRISKMTKIQQFFCEPLMSSTDIVQKLSLWAYDLMNVVYCSFLNG